MSNKTVTQTIQELKAVGERLNAESDRLNQTVAAIEERLNEFHFGVSASAEIPDLFASIRYSKTANKQWGLVIEARYHNGDASTEWPFHQAPRSWRIAAVGALEQLIVNLCREAKQEADDIVRANEQADRALQVARILK